MIKGTVETPSEEQVEQTEGAKPEEQVQPEGAGELNEPEAKPETESGGRRRPPTKKAKTAATEGEAERPVRDVSVGHKIKMDGEYHEIVGHNADKNSIVLRNIETGETFEHDRATIDDKVTGPDGSVGVTHNWQF